MRPVRLGKRARMRARRRGLAPWALALATCAISISIAIASPAGASAAATRLTASPYEYLGWGNPQAPTSVMAATGVHDITLAFMLSKGRCHPAWDGARPLTGGGDQAAIESIRAAGGDVVVSFGGWSGKKLGTACRTASALAGAYQQVINAYGVKAIDIDIEHSEFTNASTRKRVVAALAMIQSTNPGIEISVTLGTAPTGPDRDGESLIADAAAVGLLPSAWTVMPFDFGVPESSMGATSIQAAEGLARDIAATYHITIGVAYQHAGISSMIGRTDEADETVSVEDFSTMLSFAQQNHLARFTFWSVNRDRPCEGANQTADDCSGVGQQPYAYSDVIAQFQG